MRTEILRKISTYDSTGRTFWKNNTGTFSVHEPYGKLMKLVIKGRKYPIRQHTFHVEKSELIALLEQLNKPEPKVQVTEHE